MLTADAAEAVAEQQKQAGAGPADAMAKAVHSAADELQQQIPLAAEFVHAAAAQLEKGADALRTHSIGEFMSGFKDLGRKQPLALFGAAIAAGFAASRFLKSSTDRPHSTDTSH